MVKHLPNHPKANGSSTATVAGTIREEMAKNVQDPRSVAIAQW